MIYFIETYTGTKIPYNVVHKANEQRWKDLHKKSSLRLAYDGPTENFSTSDEEELYENYCDFVDFIFWYKNRGE